MKVLLVNGSPHAEGNTYVALHEMKKYLWKRVLKQKFCI